MVANPKQGYEYVTVEGKPYLVCATITCRKPLIIGQGMDPLYTLPEVGEPHPWKKQSVCGPCYKAEFAAIYPGSPEPDVKDAFLPGADPIPVDWVNPEEEPVDDDYALWRRAVEQAAGSQGAETVPQAYKRLLSVPEILGVEDQPAPPEGGRQRTGHVDVVAVRE